MQFPWIIRNICLKSLNLMTVIRSPSPMLVSPFIWDGNSPVNLVVLTQEKFPVTKASAAGSAPVHWYTAVFEGERKQIWQLNSTQSRWPYILRAGRFPGPSAQSFKLSHRLCPCLGPLASWSSLHMRTRESQYHSVILTCVLSIIELQNAILVRIIMVFQIHN
jgi:hypothetical protein